MGSLLDRLGSVVADVEVVGADDRDDDDAADAPLGTGVSYEGMVSGALQHNAYHGGQVALLRRAAGRP